MARRKRQKRRSTWKYGWYNRPAPSGEVLIEQLQPLLSQVQKVDCITETIRRGEGCLGDLQALTQCLAESFSLPASDRKKVALIRPADIRNSLFDIKRDLHLETHALDKFPSYLLCRIDTDWDTPDTIVEELYLSPRNDFFPDERFVVLMRTGRSRTFLRLSLFRDRLIEHLAACSEEDAGEEECDEILQAVAKLVIGAAWYEDQRLPFHVADVFGLGKFRAALELVAFILGSDLYKVSTYLRHSGDKVIEFFEQVYDNESLAKLLKQLHLIGKTDISRLEEIATKSFVRLNAAFADFLSTSGALCNLEDLELYRIVLGCFYNLREVADRDTWTPVLEEASGRVEVEAEQCLRSIFVTL